MTSQPTTLSYAQPAGAMDVAVMPRQWFRRATALWATTLLVEKLVVGWVVVSIISIPRDWLRLAHLSLNYAIVPLAGVVLIELIRLRRKPQVISTTMWIASLAMFCAVVTSESLMLSSGMNRGGRGIPATTWVFRIRNMLFDSMPVAWGMVIAVLALRGLPTAKRAAAMLAVGVAPLFLAAAGEAILLAANQRNWFYPQNRQWTAVALSAGALAVLLTCGLILWRRKPGVRSRRLLFALAAGSWFAASLWYAWHSGYFESVRQWISGRPPFFVQNRVNFTQVLITLADQAVLWQIAPVMLLLVATQVEETAPREMEHG